MNTRSLLLGSIVLLLGWIHAAEVHAGLIGYWPLDGDAVAAVGTDGAMVNGPVAGADRLGAASGALAFDGSAMQYVSVAGGGGLNAATTASVSMWVQWNGTQDNGWSNRHGAVLGRQKNDTFSDNLLCIFSSSDPTASNINWEARVGAGMNSGVKAGNGTWHHVVATMSPAGEALYVDGLQRATRGAFAGMRDDANIPLTIGAWIGDGDSYSTSSIDDVAVWDEVLSPDDVAVLAAPQASAAMLDERVQVVGARASSELLGTFHRHVGNVVDKVGLTTTSPDGWPSDVAGMWLSAAGETTPTATFDLGGTHALDSLMVFNYNETTAGLMTRGTQTANLSYSTDNITYTPLGTPLSFTKATGDASNPGQMKALGGIEARYVKLDITSNHGDSGYTGLGEVLFFGTAIEQLPLPIVSVTSTSDLHGGAFDRRAGHLVDGSGQFAGTHLAAPDGTSWLSDGIGYVGQPGDDGDPELVFELVDTMILQSMKIWNYNEVNNTGRGVDAMEVLVSVDGVDYDLLGTYTLAEGTGADTLLSETIALPGSMARFVKFDILSNHNGVLFPATSGTDNAFVGLGEVQFFGVQVPEPSTFVLAALGMIAVGLLRRRRTSPT